MAFSFLLKEAHKNDRPEISFIVTDPLPQKMSYTPGNQDWRVTSLWNKWTTGTFLKY